MRVYWLLGALVASVLLSGLQWWAITDFLYWRYEWFDLFMHYLGGVAIALFLVGFLYVQRTRPFIILFILLVVGWEVFEYVFGLPRESNYALDTIQDLVMDALGALTVYGLAKKTLWRSA